MLITVATAHSILKEIDCILSSKFTQTNSLDAKTQHSLLVLIECSRQIKLDLYEIEHTHQTVMYKYTLDALHIARQIYDVHTDLGTAKISDIDTKIAHITAEYDNLCDNSSLELDGSILHTLQEYMNISEFK